MVNVAGRSKGCLTCRRRRIKCDENRPICNRCQRCGFECTGAGETTFIEAKIVRSRRTIKQDPNLTRRSEAEETVLTDRQLPLTFALRGNQFEIYLCYSRKYLHRGGPLDVVLDETPSGEILTAGKANGQVLHQAILSFGILVFGSQHRQSDITIQGYTMRGLTLKQLNQALSDAKCYTRDDVLLSVAVLAILEALVPTGPGLYLEHMNGLEKILQLRDPSVFCSRKSSALYKQVRHMLLFAALRTGRPCILARKGWKKVLRASCSEEELEEQDLYDFLADCTVLTAERNDMLANWGSGDERALQQRDTLRQRALTLLSDLHAWKKKWDSDVKNSCSETSALFERPQSTQEALEDNSPSFDTTFDFPSDSASTMLMFYNTTLIYILQIFASLPLDNPAAQSSQDITQNTMDETGRQDDLLKYTKEGYVAAERSAALDICRCIPHYMARISSLDRHTSPVIHWSITTAWLKLRGLASADGRWMMDQLNKSNRKIIAQALFAR